MRRRVASGRSARIKLYSLLAVLTAQVAVAAPRDATEATAFAGAPLEQRFVGGDVSAVRTPRGAACVASATIAIDASRYVEPDGTETPFAAITRSRAASIQLVAGADGARRLRIQFKYPLDPAAPVTLSLPDREIDLAPFREPAGDSVLVDAPELVAAIEAAMAASAALGVEANGAPTGAALRLVARSRDTGRRVEDALPPVDLVGLAACLETLPAVAETLAPVAAVSVEFSSARDEAFRVSPETARICVADYRGEPVYLGAVQRVTGFFAQTSRVYVTYDDAGAISGVYIPGVFTARADGDGYAADLSRAANANDPLGAADTSGCLGAAPVSVCAYPGEDSSGPLTRFGPCVGALAGDPFADPTLLAGDLPAAGGPIVRAARAAASAPAAVGPTSVAAFGGPNGFGPGGVGGGGRTSRGPSAPDPSDPTDPDDPTDPEDPLDPNGPTDPSPPGTPDKPPVAVVPAPGALALYLGALAVAAGFGRGLRGAARRLA